MQCSVAWVAAGTLWLTACGLTGNQSLSVQSKSGATRSEGLSDLRAISELWPARGGGASEVDPTADLSETVKVADAVVVGRVQSVSPGPNYGTDPALGSIDYALLTIEQHEKMKGPEGAVVVQIPMYGKSVQEVQAAFAGKELLLFLRSLEVDAQREGRDLSGERAQQSRVLNMHGLVVNERGQAVRPWESEEFAGAPEDFDAYVAETRGIAESQAHPR